VKKNFFKLIIALLIQVVIFLVFYKILKIRFINSFIVSFNFILLSSILVFGRSLAKNIYVLPIVLANILFIILFFSLGNTAKFNNIVIDPNVIQKIESLKSFLVMYTPEESKKIRDVFYLITVGEYDSAYSLLSILKKDMLIDAIEDFLLKSKQDFIKDFNSLEKYYINFDKLKEFYQKREYQYLLDRLKPNIFNNEVEKVYNSIKNKMMATQNKDFLKDQFLVTVNQFLNQAKNKEVFSYLISALPGLYKVYKESFSNYENTTVTYRDFEELKTSNIYRGMMTLINYQDKLSIFYVESLVEPKSLYPLWGYNTYIITDSKVFYLGITKITTDKVIYFENNKINILDINGIYHKIKNTVGLMSSPFNPMWLFTYRKDYKEVFDTTIKHFWTLFLKFIFTIVFSSLIIIITIDYFKTIFPTVMPGFFYILPFLFLLILSFLYSSLSLKFTNFIFRIF